MADPDFINSDKTVVLYVKSYDDRGDPYPPDNFRVELYPNSVNYCYQPCERVDRAWKRAHELAAKLKLTQTSESKTQETEDKKWAKSFGVKAWGTGRK